ncbi:MAG TPA: hypothetical protein VNL73_11320 [Verrucomicrobiae bacterium]|nr:hypothetical protein [Verrucomicrobiae bacterium]
MLVTTSMAYLFIYDTLGSLKKVVEQGNVRAQNLKELWGHNIERLDVAPGGEIVGIGVGYPNHNLLHLYTGDGKFIRDFFPLDSIYTESSVKFPSVDVDTAGDVWCVYPPFHKVFRYGINGSRKKEIVGKTQLFKPPDKLKGPISRKSWLKWLKTWTPVVECAATQSGYVLLVMLAGEKGKPFVKNYNPERMYDGGFFIDIYDREGNLMAGGLHTPHRFLCVDDKDNLWFALAPETPENPAKDGPVVLGKYKLNLKPMSVGKKVSKTGR